MSAGARRRALARVLFTSACVFGLALAFSSAPALAGGFKLSTSFGSEGTGLGAFEGPRNVAVEASTGDVLVFDAGNGRVERFTPEGAVLGAFTGSEAPCKEFGGLYEGLAVDNSTETGDLSRGDVYVAANGEGAVDKFDTSGKCVGEIAINGEPRGVAVDSKGDVYVTSEGRVHEFDDEGNAVATIEATDVGFRASGVAVNATGSELYVVNPFENVVKLKLEAGGKVESESVLDSNKSTAVAVDSEGNVYVFDTQNSKEEAEAHVAVFNSSGALTGEFGAGEIASSHGLADSPFNEHVYVADYGKNEVHVFVEGLPEVTGCGSTTPTPVSAIVSCTVNPNGLEAAKWYVEYGEPGHTFTKTLGGAVAFTGEVSETLKPLNPGTTYQWRLVAENKHGPTTAKGEFTTEPAVKGVGQCSARAIENESATLEASLEPEPGELPVEYRFEYGKAPYEHQTSWTPLAAVGAVTVSVPQGAEAPLEPHTTYHCRLVAHDVYGTLGGPDGQFTTTGPPVVEGESVSEVGTASATVSAQLNAEGLEGTYRFEYGTSTGYGSATAPVSFAVGQGSVAASAPLSGLEPGTVYYVRVAVSDVHGASQGAGVTLTTFLPAVSGLPDGRVYEMVTPVQNQDANVYVPSAGVAAGNDLNGNGVPTERPFRAAADGSAVAYVGDPTSSGNGSDGQGGGNEYMAVRSAAGGWSQRNIQPPGYRYPVYLAFSGDLSVGILESNEPLAKLTNVPSGDVDYSYIGDDGSYQALPGEYEGASPNGGHVLVRYAGSLYDLVEGQMRPVGVLPDGEPSPGSFAAGWSHGISADGSDIFFEAAEVGSHALYVRENDTTTVQVDASQGPGSGGGGEFQTATSDGSEVFFTDSSRLTEDAGSGANLYEYDVPSGALTDLTPSSNPSILGVIAVSEGPVVNGEGEYVYFVAEGALAGNENGNKETAKQGAPNLYVSHDDVTTFIATLAPQDGGEVAPFGPFNLNYHVGDWGLPLGLTTAEVAPDGHSVVFMSVRSLTGYPNEGREEVYVYEAEGGRLSCVSCARSGEGPTTTRANASELVAAFVPISYSNTYLPRWISDDGSRVFFDSAEPLVPTDTNGEWDVYEWERDGAGSCRQSTGCVYLLSGGTGSTASWLLDASANGDDVFIITRAQLVLQDQNDDYNIFDARAGGVQPVSPPVCEGTGCQGVPPAPPIFATPSSETFNGVGNFSPSSKPSVKPKAKRLTRAQKLSKALKACKKKQKSKRASCEAQAERRYGAKSKAKKTAKGRKQHV